MSVRPVVLQPFGRPLHLQPRSGRLFHNSR